MEVEVWVLAMVRILQVGFLRESLWERYLKRVVLIRRLKVKGRVGGGGQSGDPDPPKLQTIEVSSTVQCQSYSIPHPSLRLSLKWRLSISIQSIPESSDAPMSHHKLLVNSLQLPRPPSRTRQEPCISANNIPII